MTEAEAGTKIKSKIKPPSMYKVILLNDDYTPMDFVVAVLQQIFDKNADEAVDIMLKVHNEGRGVAGIYTYEIAKQKQDETHIAARRHSFPLKTKLEESII